MQLFSNFIIDRIVYAAEPKKKHQKRIDAPEEYDFLSCTSMDAPVMLPPANSSAQTKHEMQEIVMAQTSHKNPGKLEQKYDDMFLDDFGRVIKKAGHDFDVEKCKRLVKEAASITIRLKYKYNRPRPFQLESFLGIDVTKYSSSTAKTPAFPSGHSAQSMLVALYLGDKYPDLKDKLIGVAKDISLSRLVGGHHFPSDIKYGEMLGKWMHSNLK